MNAYPLVTTVVKSARPNFLVLSFSVVLLGISIAAYDDVLFSWRKALVILSGAILAHMAVNLLNEYQDYHSGLDKITRKTPFSGGSGALIDNPEAAKGVLVFFWITVILLVAVGFVLIQDSGWGLVPIGLLGLLLIVFYTKTITRMPWLCLVAPGFAFGPLMVIGTYYALGGQISILVILLSMVPFFLVNNLLLLNQIPDIDADKQVGRYNVLMHLGSETGLQIFAAFMWLSFIALGVAIWLLDLPQAAMLGFASLLIVFPMLRKLQEDYQNIDKLLPVLAMNVIITLITPVLIAVGLFIG